MTARLTYTKPNSYTQQACRQSTETVKRITDAVSIAREDWLHILFETGCRLLENKVDNYKTRKLLLENIRYGFWSWWIWAFVQDDERLLAGGFSVAYIKHNYRQLKQDMADYVVIEGETDFFSIEPITDL